MRRLVTKVWLFGRRRRELVTRRTFKLKPSRVDVTAEGVYTYCMLVDHSPIFVMEDLLIWSHAYASIDIASAVGE
jgi:hypothetical protein